MLEGPKGLKSSLYADNKAVALKSIDNLPPIIQPKVKNFFKGGSNGYVDFSVEEISGGSYIVKMTKPGNIPGSMAIYYKVIDANGNTKRVYKETYDPKGNLLHIKDK